MISTSYVGRFAPSPSGPLHFGSLIAALGSYFDARSHDGHWLVRMEDLDPPREMAGAADLILRTLEAYQLHWDGEVVYQSTRHQRYQAQIELWLATGQAYFCQCTRKQIKASGGFYDGMCRDKKRNNSEPHSVRLRMDHPVTQFFDEKHGETAIPHALAEEDFIIKRRDGLYAYNLAVVIDDIDQGITQIVRGADLIEPTGRQISLYKTLKLPPVKYLHLPLAMDANGNKLSKQNHAQGINIASPKAELISAMQFLRFDLPIDFADLTVEQMVSWGVAHWHLTQLPDEINITSPFSKPTS